MDKNKSISSILYNYLNLPQLITVDSKGTIQYLYDATGNKLQKIVTDTKSGNNTTTTYIGSFVYEQVLDNKGNGGTPQLQFFGQEEGRIRPVTPTVFNNNQDY